MRTQKKSIEQANFQQTFIPDIGSIRCGDLKMHVNYYPLTEYHFEQLSGYGGGLKEWSYHFFIAGLGVFFVCCAKIIAFVYSYSFEEDKDHSSIVPEPYEWISLVLAAVLGISCYTLSYFFKNKKDKLIEAIQNYFNSDRND